MITIFQIDEKVDSFQDNNIKYLEEIKARLFEFPSGLIFVNSHELEKDPESAVKKLQDPLNQSWGILEEEVSLMHQELARLIKKFEGFYYKSINENTELQPDLNPSQINYLIRKSLVRLRRMVCVLDPDYSVIRFQEKKSGNAYKMIKGYWIADNGERVRSLSRNIGNTEASINELTMKLFKLNASNVFVMEPERGISFRPDLIVTDGKTKWLVETKLLNLENFIRSYVRFEFWKIYKEEYELLG